MCRYKKWETTHIDRFEVEGNNGGDYLLINKTTLGDKQDDIVLVEVGNCCVVTLKLLVPVPVLTILFTQLFSVEDFKKTVEQIWPTPYGKELVSKIKDLTYSKESI